MNKMYYVEGNAVREMPTPAEVRRQEKTRRELEEIQRKKNRRNAARRNQERAFAMNRAYVAFLSVCVAISAFAAVSLIQIQSDITNRMRSIARLESQVEDLRADNDSRYKRISTSVDRNQIKETAIKELGMHYATEEQVFHFTIENTNFMDQYRDIPE